MRTALLCFRNESSSFGVVAICEKPLGVFKPLLHFRKILLIILKIGWQMSTCVEIYLIISKNIDMRQNTPAYAKVVRSMSKHRNACQAIPAVSALPTRLHEQKPDRKND